MTTSIAVNHFVPGMGRVPAAFLRLDLDYARGFKPEPEARREIELEAVGKIEEWLRAWKASHGVNPGAGGGK